MIFLAIDSGLERTGYAVIKKEADFHLMKYGLIETQKTLALAARLVKLAEEVRVIIKKYTPELMVMEQIFFNNNQKTVISVAQAQGAVMFMGAQLGLKVEFLTPLAIKQSLTGYGRADKKQVQKMVGLLLGIKELPRPDDVVDAIACGLAYSSTMKLSSY